MLSYTKKKLKKSENLTDNSNLYLQLLRKVQKRKMKISMYSINFHLTKNKERLQL